MSNIYEVFSSEFIHNRIEAAETRTKEFFLTLPPYRIEIQPTSFCNRRCSFCSHTSRNKSGNELTQSQVLHIINSVTKIGTKHLSISGGGEPLEWRKGDLESIIEYAQGFLDVTLTTNGDGFWDDLHKDINHSCILSLCSNIIINVPGVDETTYKELIRGNASWKRTKSVLSQIVKTKKKNKYNCVLCCVVVVNKKNYRDLLTIDKELIKLGIDRIYYKTMKDYENHRLSDLVIPEKDAFEIYSYLQEDSSCWLKHFAQAFQYAEKVKSTRCWSNLIGLSAIIDPNGNVFVCTPTVGNQKYVLGNIKHTDFIELWKSEKRWEIIQKLNHECLIGVCPNNCRFLAHNMIIENYLNAQSSSEHYSVNAGIDDKME